MSVQFLTTESLSNPSVDVDAAAVAVLNKIFRASGLCLSTASTQLHVTPEAVGVINPKDLPIVTRYARVLVSHRDVQCDFNALSSGLWNCVKNVDSRIDLYLHSLESSTRGRQTKGTLNLQVPHLQLLIHAIHILRQMEEPYARQEVRDAVSIVQKDVETVVRLGAKLSRVLSEALSEGGGVDSRFLLATDVALGATEVFAACIASRSAIDVSPLVGFFNSEVTWRLSGVSVAATTNYCEALYRLIQTLFARQNDFDGVEQATAKLIVTRLTARPPFDWETFRRMQSPRRRITSPQFAVLCNMTTVRFCVQGLFLRDNPYINTLKGSCSRLLKEMNERKEMLSFYQVLLLAALRGMPEVNLSDDAQLHHRAEETRLGNDERIMHPNLLRILMAYGYTVSHDGHSSLSPGSVLSLFRAITEQLLQLPLIKSGDVNNLTDLLLRPPVLTLPLIRLVVQFASQNETTASDILNEMVGVLTTMYEASVAHCELLQSPGKVPQSLRRVLVLATQLFFEFFRYPLFVGSTDHVAALEALARIFAIARLYVTTESNATEAERKSAVRFLARIGKALSAVSDNMKVSEINNFFMDVLLPRSSVESMSQRNPQQYALLEGYIRAFSSGAVAVVMEEETLLKHWVDISLRCIKNRLSGTLAVAGLDLFSVIFLSKRAVAPLFVPTYVELMVPTSWPSRYGEPPLYLARHFAKTVRSCCQALERCDGRALEEIVRDRNSSVAKVMLDVCGNIGNLTSLESIRPLSSVLLIVSSLFDKVCVLLGHTITPVPTSTQDRLTRFQVYYSALINLLQCRSTTVLHRVCASVEAVMLEQLRGVPSVQAQWIKHIGNIVDSLQGIGKTAVAEWFLMLTEKTRKMIPHSKL